MAQISPARGGSGGGGSVDSFDVAIARHVRGSVSAWDVASGTLLHAAHHWDIAPRAFAALGPWGDGGLGTL